MIVQGPCHTPTPGSPLGCCPAPLTKPTIRSPKSPANPGKVTGHGGHAHGLRQRYASEAGVPTPGMDVQEVTAADQAELPEAASRHLPPRGVEQDCMLLGGSEETDPAGSGGPCGSLGMLGAEAASIRGAKWRTGQWLHVPTGAWKGPPLLLGAAPPVLGRLQSWDSRAVSGRSRAHNALWCCAWRRQPPLPGLRAGLLAELRGPSEAPSCPWFLRGPQMCPCSTPVPNPVFLIQAQEHQRPPGPRDPCREGPGHCLCVHGDNAGATAPGPQTELPGVDREATGPCDCLRWAGSGPLPGISTLSLQWGPGESSLIPKPTGCLEAERRMTPGWGLEKLGSEAGVQAGTPDSSAPAWGSARHSPGV